MNTPTEKPSVEQLIAAYAVAVNNGDRKAISSFYTEDGLLLPEGFKSVPQGRSSGNYFTNTSIDISFSVKHVVIEGNYAFVEARAKTRLINLYNNDELNKTTRDVFVLRNGEGDWKIFRYIFNSENEA